MRFVVALMDDAKGLPSACPPFVLVEAADREASTLAHKMEERHASQPDILLSRIGLQWEFALQLTSHERGAISSIVDQRKQEGPAEDQQEPAT